MMPTTKEIKNKGMHFIFLMLFDKWGMTVWKLHFADRQNRDKSESQPLSSPASQQGIVCFDKASQVEQKPTKPEDC